MLVCEHGKLIFLFVELLFGLICSRKGAVMGMFQTKGPNRTDITATTGNNHQQNK